MSLTPRIDKIDSNILINGNFRFWQRALSAAAPGYCSDRWSGVSGVNSQSRQTNTSGTNSLYMMQVGGTSGDIGIGQRVDAAWSRYIVNSTVTVGFYARINSGSSTNFAVRIVTPTTPNNYAAFTQTPYSVSGLNGTWKKFVVQINITASMITNGFAVGIVDIGNVGGVVLQIADVVALDGTFEDVNYSLAGDNLMQEFALCQRYYEKSYNQNDLPTAITRAGCMAMDAASTASRDIKFTTPKRGTPTIVIYNPDTGATGTAREISTFSSPGSPADRACAVYNAAENSFHAEVLTSTDNLIQLFHWTADAEI